MAIQNHPTALQLTEQKALELQKIARITLRAGQQKDIVVLSETLSGVVRLLIHHRPSYLVNQPRIDWLNQHPCVQYLAHKIRNTCCVNPEDHSMRRAERAVEDMARLV